MAWRNSSRNPSLAVRRNRPILSLRTPGRAHARANASTHTGTHRHTDTHVSRLLFSAIWLLLESPTADFARARKCPVSAQTCQKVRLSEKVHTGAQNPIHEWPSLIGRRRRSRPTAAECLSKPIRARCLVGAHIEKVIGVILLVLLLLLLFSSHRRWARRKSKLTS